ncbi:hypothetical protein KFL_000060070 [Klebsormidium nitens]|uniref:Inward rectifier potassium channel C-terminal domain-containing protein n=1 Tax=Klebsormidium nitens TaxID=105231 RepID=A0A0U9HI61_KLENI|nr:hypothetical protein KFL_000060070 [Klebsormidium nitens]|eukprot:GAQ77942.1 hypothetical protein KFL_000060070 [Klebsormidium nitens]
MYPPRHMHTDTSLQRCRTPWHSPCCSKRQETERTLSLLGNRSLERRGSGQSALAVPGSEHQAAFATTINSPARRRSSEVGSGRYAASVIRTRGGRKRIRRAKDGDGEENDDNMDERYTSLEDAPIYGSVHGDSFDYDDQNEVPSPLAEDASTEERSAGNEEPVEEQEASPSDRVLASTSEEKGTSKNGAASREPDMEQKGMLRSVTVSTALPKEKVKKTAKSGKKVAGKKSRSSTSLESANGVSRSVDEDRTEVTSQKKGKTSMDKAGVGSNTEAEGSRAIRKEAQEKPVKKKKAAAPKLKRSKAFNGRMREGELAVARTETLSQNGAQPSQASTAVEQKETLSQNGAEPSETSTDVEEESLLDRIASSLQAGSSSSKSDISSGALQLRFHSGCAFVVTAAAAKRVEDLVKEGEAAGVGAGLLGAASSLVDNLVDSAQTGGEIVSAVGEAVVESVSGATDAVTGTVSQLSEQVMEVVSSGVEEITDTVESAGESVSALVETVADTVDTVTSSMAETVDSVTSTVAETVGDVGEAVVSLMTEEEELGDTEFEAFRNQAGPQLRGRAGLDNLRVLSDGANLMQVISDAYTFTLKLPPLQFSLVVVVLPLLMSLVFTGVYLLDMQGLVPDDSVQSIYDGLQKGGHVAEAHWYALFQVFMFSLSLATGLQPVLAPVTPFSFVAANVNALLAQLLFVFLSGSVFARLSQRSRPIRCSTVALICPPCHENRSGKEWSNKVLMARYVLVGTRPSELVDVKVDLTFHYNTLTRNGSYFNRQVSLKLVRSEVAHQTGGMLVRHVIDESSPLYRRTEEMLKREDAIFKLSVVGLERSSMQSVFELQYYCVADGDVIWDAEFEDVVLVNKSMQRVIDQSKVSRWRSVPTTGYRTISA